MIKPTEKFPNVKFKLINDMAWELEKQEPESFTLLVFYRGYHCPVCRKQLTDLKAKLNDFTERGINVIAVSMDSEERAKKTGEEWKTGSVPIGYGMNEETARSLGLYISNAISDSEPKVFSEPGLFLVKKDGTLYCSSIQTMPFARPGFDHLLGAIDFVKSKDYPARGGK